MNFLLKHIELELILEVSAWINYKQFALSVEFSFLSSGHLALDRSYLAAADTPLFDTPPL